MLLTINSVDFTPYIISKTYEVNKQDTYESWTDANGILHRSIYRTHISGDFDMKFIDRTKYNAFLTALSAVKTDGYYPVTVYVNNTLSTETINAFITIKPAMSAQYANYPEMEQFSVEVMQR